MAKVFVIVFFWASVAIAAQGTVKETADFKIMVPDGWEFSDFGNGAAQTYNKSGSYMVELNKAGSNMSEAAVENGVAGIAKQYKGTGPERRNDDFQHPVRHQP